MTNKNLETSFKKKNMKTNVKDFSEKKVTTNTSYKAYKISRSLWKWIQTHH